MVAAFKGVYAHGGGEGVGLASLVLVSSAQIDVGDVVVIRVACDNAGAATPTFTATDDAGNSWSTHAQGAVNATAGAGVAGAVIISKMTVPATVFAPVTVTIALSHATTAWAAYAEVWTGVDTVRASGVTVATGAGTAPSVANTVPVEGDLVVVAVAVESGTTPSALDADTTNGSWEAAGTRKSATGGTDTAHVEIVRQSKIVTATGTQTHTITTVSTDWVAMMVVLSPLAAPLPAPMQASVKLYSPAGVFVSDLVTQSDVKWQDVFNDVGTGSFTLQVDDPDVALVVSSALVYCYLDATHVFTWVVDERPALTQYDPGEDANYVISVSGPGYLSLASRQRVYPFKGTDPQVMAQHRIFSFASPDYPNDADWIFATEIAVQSYIDPIRQAMVEYTTVLSEGDEPDVVELVAAAAPLDWPAPTAFWIWGDPDTLPVGFNYFRGAFSLAAQTPLVIAATADNYWTLYLDGTPLMGDQGEGIGWLEHKRVNLTLPAGDYYLSAVVENIPLPDHPPEDNPSALLVAIFTVDADDKVTSVIATTDDQWIAKPYPANTPGWRAGQIVQAVVAEAQARGGLPVFDLNFTDEQDSAGADWIGDSGASGSFIPGLAVPVGATVLDVLEALRDGGWVDFRWNATLGELDMWNAGTTVATGITFAVTGDVATQNLVSQSFESVNAPTTALFVKYAAGFVELVDATAVATYGRHEGYMTMDVTTATEALRLAQLSLDAEKDPHHSIVVEIDPVDDTADYPYLQFVPGNTVLVPAALTKTSTAFQVLSITVGSDEMGYAKVVLELDRRGRSPERDLYDLTQTLGRGVTGSTKVRIAVIAATDTIGR